MKTNIQRLDDLQEALNKTSNGSVASCSVADSAHAPGLLVEGLQYKRGSTTVSLSQLSLQRGQVYAVTGANGCGKSTFFGILASCSEKAPALPGGVEIPTAGRLTLMSKDIVEVTQQLYC